MQTIGTVAEMRRAAAEARARGKSIGFGPTMGYLHEGSTNLLEIVPSETLIAVAAWCDEYRLVVKILI